MPKWLDRLRDSGNESVTKVNMPDESDQIYREAIKSVQDVSQESVSKGMNGKRTSYAQPLLKDVTMGINPDFKTKPAIRNAQDLHKVLKKFGNNIILNAIIGTRSNQVSMYCKPARNSENGVGYEITLKDQERKPGKQEKNTIKQIEDFLEYTGKVEDSVRDNFTLFCKKIVRDTYMYDQVNFEKIFDRNGNFVKFETVDPSTIFLATDDKGNVIEHGERYVQVFDNRVVARFNDREMAFAVRNPRTDIHVGDYGYSELEIALKQFIAHENTETFNDRFFSHGGTTRGLLLLKAGQQQSTQALDIFRREWKNSLSGINGSWQIPVVTAEDAKFINMTPTANDMQFEKWLNYLINVISALYGIDPAEINFPNNGGATGSKGGSLNEGNQKDKMQASQNKGLQPLLQFIEDTVNRFIIAEFGDKYQFRFRGGDVSAQLEKIEVLRQEGKVFRTVNEIRAEYGLPPIQGGDIIMDGVHIQSIGQEIQKQQFEYQKQQDRINRIMEGSGDVVDQVENESSDSSAGVSVQDQQKGMTGESSDTGQGVGKDGQMKDQENANAAGIGGKEGRKWDR